MGAGEGSGEERKAGVEEDGVHAPGEEISWLTEGAASPTPSIESERGRALGCCSA